MIALRERIDQAEKLDQVIWANLEDIGYGGWYRQHGIRRDIDRFYG